MKISSVCFSFSLIHSKYFIRHIPQHLNGNDKFLRRFLFSFSFFWLFDKRNSMFECLQRRNLRRFTSEKLKKKKKKKKKRKTMHACTRIEEKIRHAYLWLAPVFLFYVSLWKKEKEDPSMMNVCSLSSQVFLAYFLSCLKFTGYNANWEEEKTRTIDMWFILIKLIWEKWYLTWNPVDKPPFRPSVLWKGKKTNTNEQIFFP